MGCGWCIDANYNSECLNGDMAGPLTTSPINCTKGWYAGRYHSPASMCVMVLSNDDVRCYQSCTYGQGIETFIVPDQQTCQQYDSAYKSSGADATTRKAVIQYLTRVILDKATNAAGIELSRLRTERVSLVHEARSNNRTNELTRLLALAPLDMTRDLIGWGVNKCMSEGLPWLERAGCTAVAWEPPAALFCIKAVNSPFGTYVNKQILCSERSIVKNCANWLIDTCDEHVPSGVRNVIDDVADAWNEGGGKEIYSIGKAAYSICSGIYGWFTSEEVLMMKLANNISSF